MPGQKKIDLPPAVTEALVGLGNFIGRHVAEGVKRGKSSALKEISARLKYASEVVDRASNEDEDVVEIEQKRTSTGGRRRGR